MDKNEDMDSPQISRSGRVLKKSARVKEMEDFDINELEIQGKGRKKQRSSDDFDDFDDKKVAPIKIQQKQLKRPQMMQQPKSKQQFFDDSSGDGSKSDSSSVSSSSSSSSSSSDDSDAEGMPPSMRQRTVIQNIQHQSNQHQEKVEPYRQAFNSPSFDNELSMDASEDEASDSALVIAEESNDSFIGQKVQRAPVKKKAPVRKAPAPKKKPPTPRSPAKKEPKEKSAPKRPLSAYMLWCIENRKRIVASGGDTAFSSMGKKLGEAWQALPDKEKMAWRRKAKRLALRNSSQLISPSPPSARHPALPPPTEDPLRGNVGEGGAPRALGTGAIDSAAYLKLLGDSLSVIGQRLTEHEGQLAVSGIFSVLLDTILCVVGPLLCLTSESPLLDCLPQDTSRNTLDSIAYFMPGL